MACSTNDEVYLTGQKTITIDLSGDFEVSTRSSDFSEIKDILVFDYMDGQCVQFIHQQKGDTNFGKLDIILNYGKHTLYFVASSGDGLKTTTTTVTWDKVADTFWGYKNIEVNANTTSSISVILDRVTTVLEVISTDVMPDDKKYVAVTFGKWSNSIVLTTGKPNKFGTYTIRCQLHNTSYADFTVYGIASNEEYSTDVKLDCYSNSGLIKSHIVQNVPFLVSRVTTIKGAMFGNVESNSYNCNLQLNDEWNFGHCIQW